MFGIYFAIFFIVYVVSAGLVGFVWMLMFLLQKFLLKRKPFESRILLSSLGYSILFMGLKYFLVSSLGFSANLVMLLVFFVAFVVFSLIEKKRLPEIAVHQALNSLAVGIYLLYLVGDLGGMFL